MKNNITVVYAFDNEKEIPFWRISIKSLLRTNGPNINVLTVVSNELLESKVKALYNSLKLGKNFEVFKMKTIPNFPKNGQFFWIRSALVVSTKYILQIDNDVILNGKIQNLFNSVLENKKFETKKIWAVKIRLSKNAEIIRTLKNTDNYKFPKKRVKNWINTGVVLLNAEWLKTKYNSQEELSFSLEKYNNESKKNIKPMIADESFLIKNFDSSIGYLHPRWNLRFQSPKSTRKYIKENEWFFHFNLRMKKNNKYLKYNFDNLLFSNEVDLDIEINNLVDFLVERYKGMKYPYLKSIIRSDTKRILNRFKNELIYDLNDFCE